MKRVQMFILKYADLRVRSEDLSRIYEELCHKASADHWVNRTDKYDYFNVTRTPFNTLKDLLEFLGVETFSASNGDLWVKGMQDPSKDLDGYRKLYLGIFTILTADERGGAAFSLDDESDFNIINGEQGQWTADILDPFEPLI